MTDTHEFINGGLLSKRPPDINRVDWDLFIKEMAAANNYEELDHPLQIDIELNSGCNMACPFCRHGYEKIENKNMEIQDYYKIVSEAVKIGTKSLKLNYINEPMLRKDLEDCIKYAKEAGILNVYLVTNGTLLTAKRRKRILESGLTKLFISIDASTAQIYNKQRLDGRFNLVVNNVLSLIKERNESGMEFPIVRVSFLKNQINIHESEEFEIFWKDKADIIAFQKMDEVPDIKTNLTIKNVSASEDGCQFPFKQMVIDSDGDILPCCKMFGKKLVLGNIKDNTLEEAWNSEKMKELHLIHSNGEWINSEICRNCILGY